MDILTAYWSRAELITNGVIVLHLAGALVTGILLGYERSYHGRAAGMRTYGLVCMASATLTVIVAYPAMWYGGAAAHWPGVGDPTRVIQGIVTGIGFLGAGVIMREGFAIRGLSTAASIWSTAAIGVTIGMGFFAAAIAASGLAILMMGGFRRLEAALPHRSATHLTLVFARDRAPPAERINDLARERGFDVIDWGFHLVSTGQLEYKLVLQAKGTPDLAYLVNELSKAEEVVEFHLSPSRI
jgi:putative Mg2+ transporter-C (MgtC) family protein